MEAAQGVKILGKDLEKTLAGLPLLVAHKEDEIPVLKVSGFFLQSHPTRRAERDSHQEWRLKP